MEGTIKHWNPERFFGFIQGSDRSYFFHGTDVIGDAKELQGGEAVIFELASDPRGTKGVRVEIQ